jgi:pimeloyl-ACP methyl ester carboxylesterase
MLAAVGAEAVDPRGTVLLVPGLTGSKEDFAAQLLPLAAAGWRAVAVDLFGQYQSDGSDDPDDYTLAELGTDLSEVIAGLAGPVTVVGHSFGGLVSREAVLAGATVDRLLLLDSGPAALPPGRRREMAELMAAHAMAVPAETAWEWLVAVQTEEGTWPPPDAGRAGFLRERWITTRPAHMAGCAAALLAAPDRTDELRGRTVHLLFGEHEDAWPEPLQSQWAARLGVTPVVIPGAGHSPAVEQPALTTAAILRLLQ